MAQDEMMLVPVKPDIEMLKAMVRYWQSLPGQIPFAHLDRGTEDALIGKAIYTWEAALSAAPAQPAAVEGAGEPVAWRWRWKDYRGRWVDWRFTDETPEIGADEEVQPLYAHPSPPADDALRVAVEALEQARASIVLWSELAEGRAKVGALEEDLEDIDQALAALKAGGVK